MEQSARATGGKQHVARVDGLNLARMRVKGHDAGRLLAVVGEHQVGHIPFLGELDAGGHALLPQGVQNLVADAVGRIGGALDRGTAELARVAAEPALGDMPVIGTGEGHALTLQVDHGLRRVFGEQFGRILVHQPVAALDGVVVMPVPVIGLHIAQARGDAALGRTGVRTQRLQFGDHEDLRVHALFPELGDFGGAQQSQRRRQAGRSGADDHRIIHIFQTFRTHGFDSRTPAEQSSSRVMKAD